MRTELSGERVTLRPGRDGEAETIARILRTTVVAERWGEFSDDEITEQFIGANDVLVVEFEEEIIGAIQYHEEEDPMYRHAGIDIFLAPSHHGRGLATEAIRVLSRYLLFELGHHRLTIDPAADNVAAIRAYERVGFRPVGVMRKYERGPDGVWHDGLLMDMLIEDFRDGA
jgi:aminoglycoside 6'-N-acetyltransferase